MSATRYLAVATNLAVLVWLVCITHDLIFGTISSMWFILDLTFVAVFLLTLLVNVLAFWTNNS